MRPTRPRTMSCRMRLPFWRRCKDTLPKVLSRNSHKGISYELGRKKTKDDIERRDFPSTLGLGASSAVGCAVRMTESEAARIDQGDIVVEQSRKKRSQ